jgi:hypothetical protein
LPAFLDWAKSTIAFHVCVLCCYTLLANGLILSFGSNEDPDAIQHVSTTPDISAVDKNNFKYIFIYNTSYDLIIDLS